MIVVGAKGHAADIISDASLFDHEADILFFDSITSKKDSVVYNNYRVITSIATLNKIATDKRFILAIGTPVNRELLYKKFIELGYIPKSFISSIAMVSEYASLKQAVNIMPFAAVFAKASIGLGTLINSYASVHHNASLGEFCVISPGARVLGRVMIEGKVEVGANAIILPDIKVGAGAIIGAGAVVTKNIPPNVVVTGVPGKIVRQL